MSVAARGVDQVGARGRGSVLLWPGFVAASMGVYWALTGPAALPYDTALQVHFLVLCAGIYVVERMLPYHAIWNTYDRQTWNDVVYNVTFTVAQIGAATVAVWIAGSEGAPAGTDLFGLHWPFVLQLALLVVVVELIYYVYHRAFHVVQPLWKFHAVHHSSHQLHILNNARVHPLEVFIAFLPILLFASVARVPVALLNWYFAFQLTIGLLTHSNIAVHSGWFSWLFNTPELHHWHHSRLRQEQDNNYGSVTMLWDHLFGTYYNPRHRRASWDIGTSSPVPPGLLGQLAYPFRRAARHKKGT